MFEVFRIVNEAGKITYELGPWIFVLTIIGIILFFILGYCLKVFIDTRGQKNVNQFIKDNQKDIEKFKNNLDAELESFKTANENNLQRIQLDLNRQLEEYKTKLNQGSEEVLKVFQSNLDKSLASYTSQLDSASSLSLRDELVVKLVKTQNILKANDIAIEIYQDLLKAKFLLRDNSDLINQDKKTYNSEYHKDFLKHLTEIKDKIYINEMYLNKKLYEAFLYIIIAITDLSTYISMKTTPINSNTKINAQNHLSAVISNQFVIAMQNIQNNQKTDLTLNDIDISITEEEITKEIRSGIISASKNDNTSDNQTPPTPAALNTTN